MLAPAGVCGQPPGIALSSGVGLSSAILNPPPSTSQSNVERKEEKIEDVKEKSQLPAVDTLLTTTRNTYRAFTLLR